VQRWQDLDDVPADWPRTVVTIGVFDGVHRGHRLIVGRAVEHAQRLGLPPVVVTFDPHPSEVLRPGTHPPLLCTLDQRVELLGMLGVEAVCVLTFTPEFAAQSPESFARAILTERLRAAQVVVGQNFRFGNRAAGDTQTLTELGAAYGFEVDVVGLIAGTGGVWSSTYTRALVAAGDVEAAALSLGRPHRIEGVVVHGDKRGRELGFPTANLATTAHAAIPADGIYAAWLVRRPYTSLEQRLPAALSIGTNPQFDGLARKVEAYVLDRDDLDLYGEHLVVDVMERVRPTLRFDSVDALIEQMRRDVTEIRARLGGDAAVAPSG
jgi:riboflavin kinase/FMN adenylyltransferase